MRSSGIATQTGKHPKRLGELERQLIGEAVRFRMPDGSVRSMPRRRFERAVRAALQGDRTADVSLICSAVADDCTSKGFGHLGDLARIMVAARAAGPPVGEDVLDQSEGANSIAE